jgi:uncharacterized lipoprotein YmbA
MPYLPGVSLIKHCLLVTTILVLAGCSSGPPAKLYLLEPLYDLALEEEPPKVTAIGLAVVTLPGYVKDTRIASRDAKALLTLDDNHRWAESPDDAITRVLADRLRSTTEATVLVEPWPRGFDPQARVEVAFDKLLRDPTGGAEMAGQISVISGDGRRVLAVESFQLVHYASSRSPMAFFLATAAGINDVARMATAALRKFYK